MANTRFHGHRLTTFSLHSRTPICRNGMKVRQYLSAQYGSDHRRRSTRVYGTSGGREEEGRDRASSGSPSVEGGLTVEEAYQVLGLNVDSGYDQVLARKEALLEECEMSGDDAQQKALLVEIAYDTIFSSQLKARLSGDLKVSSSVRFADVKRPTAPATNAFTKLQKKVNISSVPNDLITVSPLGQEDIAIVSGVFATLLIWCLVQGTSSVGDGSAADVPGLQLALGVASVVYFQREKKRTTLSKSVIVAVIGLVVGTVVGSGLESWLRVDIVPLLGISNPATVVGSFSLLGLYLALLLLR